MLKKPVFYAILAALLLGCLFVFYKGQVPELPFGSPAQDVLKDELDLEVVDTPEARERGLGGRTDLAPDYGMLFVFDEADSYGFWMKDMLVPIDIIWLSDTGTIVGIEDSVSPDTYPNVFYPPEPVNYVLEVGAGNARAHGWHIGSTIPLPN